MESLMIRFHFHPTPNPMKVALLLEETRRANFPSNYPAAENPSTMLHERHVAAIHLRHQHPAGAEGGEA
jgi:GST-like protein